MLTGHVVASNLAYKRKVYIRPIKHYYENDHVKYSCPICDALNNPHSIPEGFQNCPQCNVNLTWKENHHDER